MKVKRGLIKGGAEPVAEPVATASTAEAGATASPAPAEGATASTAPAEGATASPPPEGATAEAAPSEAPPAEAPPAPAPAEAVAAQPAGEQEPVEEQKEEASEADASTTEGQEETARAQAEAEEEITKKLIEVNAFMKEFFESFDDTNTVVVEKAKFPEYSSNLGKLSEKIINAKKQKHIINNIEILDNYKTFLTKILSS